jgi:hypothetical protein
VSVSTISVAEPEVYPVKAKLPTFSRAMTIDYPLSLNVKSVTIYLLLLSVISSLGMVMVYSLN